MTFKIRLLCAAALLALPAVAGAQATQPQPAQQPPGTTMENVNRTVQQAQDANPPAGEQVADEQPQQPPQPAQQPVASENATPPAETQSSTQAQPAAQAGAQAQAGATAQATVADVTAGAQVRDTAGAQVGTVESVDADSAIVSTGSVRADIPITSFGRNGQGLVLAMTRAQLEAAARAATRTPGS